MIRIKHIREAGPAYAELRRTRGMPPLGRQTISLKLGACGPVGFELPDGTRYAAYLGDKPAPSAPQRR